MHLHKAAVYANKDVIDSATQARMTVRGTLFLSRHRLRRYTTSALLQPRSLPRITSSSHSSSTILSRLHRGCFGRLRSMGQLFSVGASRQASQSEEERWSSDGADVWLIVGLGNPGPRYAETRHNAGFMAIDALGRATGTRTDRLQSNCAVGRTWIMGEKAVLVKPMTFMNVSGEGIGRLCKYYRVPPEKVMVIYDDLDLPRGAVRVRGKGGHGGHNGIRSIIHHLGTNEFPRIKIGISRPREGMSIPDYVLQPFSLDERREIDASIANDVLPALRAALKLGIEKALSGVRLNVEGDIVPLQNGNSKRISKENKSNQAKTDKTNMASTS